MTNMRQTKSNESNYSGACISVKVGKKIGTVFIHVKSFSVFGTTRNIRRKYSEKSENIIGLDPCFLNRFSLFRPHLDLYQSFDWLPC